MTPYKLLFPLFIVFFSYSSYSQSAATDSTGLPGDQFSLHGALAMFKKAASPEEFEQLINNEKSNVNNLDLNGDGEIDYIRVIDKTSGDVHALILQAVISATESQDIAVIEIEKTGESAAMLQIIGDEDIYGEPVIVEPAEEETAAAIWQDSREQKGPSLSYYQFAEPMGVVVNVWTWPTVRFVYAPAYRTWISPWRWALYPAWWKPWHPLRWQVWHPRRVAYHRHYVIATNHRVIHAHGIYRPARTTSAVVRTRHSTAINQYRVTRTRTTVTGPRGNSATKTTTTVRKNGKVKAKKTTVRRRRG